MRLLSGLEVSCPTNYMYTNCIAFPFQHNQYLTQKASGCDTKNIPYVRNSSDSEKVLHGTSLPSSLRGFIIDNAVLVDFSLKLKYI